MAARQIMRVNPASPAVPPIAVRRLQKERRTYTNVQGVALLSTAFLDLPVGVTYEAFHLVYGGTMFTPTQMSAIRVIANGQIIHNITGLVRDTLNQFDKLPAASTYKVLSIYNTRVGLKEGADQWSALATAIPCAQAPLGVRTLRIEVDISSGAVAPTLEIHTDIRANNPNLARSLLRTESFVEVVPAYGAASDYLFLHKLNGDRQRPLLQRLSMNQGDSEVNRFKFQNDTREIFNRTAKGNEHVQSAEGKRSPQFGWTMIDSGEDGYSHPWQIGNVADFRSIANVTAGNYNLTCVAETLGSLPS